MVLDSFPDGTQFFHLSHFLNSCLSTLLNLIRLNFQITLRRYNFDKIFLNRANAELQENIDVEL